MSDVIYNISSGFFDSVNGDRLYSAADMNKPYKRVIADGIFPTPQGTPSTDFQVVAVSGMSVAVLAGNAMIGARWAENTDDVGITIAGNSSSSPRIDSIFLHIDTGMDTRAAGVVYRQGTAAGTPTAPAMVQTDNITELRLADILVAPSAAIITQANITDQRGGSDCPWVAGLIQQVDTSALFEQYRAAYAEQQQDQANEWNTFMDHLARDYDISMSLRKHESTYTSTAAASLIPINIDGYDTTKDLLQVYINGIFAVEGTHYIVKSAAQIQLTNAISAGQKVHFVIYKAVMGGAQPIIPTDEQVQDAVDAYMDAHPGALVVDPELSDTSTHAIQNKAVTEALAGVNGRLEELGSVSPEVKNAILNLFSHCIFKDYDPTTDRDVLTSWAMEINSVTISESTASLSGETTRQLTATTSPSGGLITWTTSNEGVATVSNAGLVTAVGNGTCIITASCGEKSANCTVTVTGIAAVFSVTNSLTHVSTNNSSVTAREGTSYVALLTADSDYSIKSVAITMGGVDVTNTVYNNGAINISSVTGDLSITAVAAQAEYALYIPSTNVGVLTTQQGKDATAKITRIDLDCELPTYSGLAVLFSEGSKWGGVGSSGTWGGGYMVSGTPAYSEVANAGREKIVFEVDGGGTNFLSLRAWSNNHPEITIYGFDIYSNDTLQASYKSTAVVGEMYDSVNDVTITWSDTTGMTVTEV